MSRFPWKSQRAQRVSHSLRDGGMRRALDALDDTASDFRKEAVRWAAHSGDAADELWRSAFVLTGVRNDVSSGVMSPDAGQEWANAGQIVLNRYYEARSKQNHPSGRAK